MALIKVKKALKSRKAPKRPQTAAKCHGKNHTLYVANPAVLPKFVTMPLALMFCQSMSERLDFV